MATDRDQAGFSWQIKIWDQMADLYLNENAPRIAPVADRAVAHADLTAGEQVLDLGTGTGTVIERVAPLVGASGAVMGTDISTKMLSTAQQQVNMWGFTNVTLREGRAEAIPAEDASFDAVIASLSLMYVIDRAAAAREMARVLRPGGRVVAAVWAGAEQNDLVRFQQIAGSFAATPPVTGVGPGVLADPSPFLEQLSEAGLESRVETETLGFEIDSFALAWDVFAGVTTATLSPERRQEAKDAVMREMWPNGDGPRHFRNVTHFIIGQKN